MGKAGNPNPKPPPRRDECVNGHDLTKDENVAVVKRGNYKERQCLPCKRKRARDWWRANRAK